jgi:hypothetical protein
VKVAVMAKVVGLVIKKEWLAGDIQKDAWKTSLRCSSLPKFLNKK